MSYTTSLNPSRSIPVVSARKWARPLTLHDRVVRDWKKGNFQHE